jgi:hypothetical protein
MEPGPADDAGATVKETTRYWVVEAKGAWRWLAGLLGALSAVGVVGLCGAGLTESMAWIGGLLLVVPFGILMTLLAARGSVRVWLGRTLEAIPQAPGDRRGEA